MTEFENLSTSEKIRVAVHRDVSSICKESCHYRGFEMTNSAIAIIAELVCKKLSVYGSDLESFAKHAKRTTINAEDVKLLVRRNPSLKAHLNKLCKTSSSATKDSKRRKTFVGKLEFAKTAGKAEVAAKVAGKPEVKCDAVLKTESPFKKKIVNIIFSDDSDDCIEVNDKMVVEET